MSDRITPADENSASSAPSESEPVRIELDEEEIRALEESDDLEEGTRGLL
ncbi:hypothetical protein [Microbacterium sp. P04]